MTKMNSQIQGIPFSLLDYIELVDWSGRIIREDKRGAISSQRPRLLSTFGYHWPVVLVKIITERWDL